jgi:microsomal prostaglandin-E synthase 2
MNPLKQFTRNVVQSRPFYPIMMASIGASTILYMINNQYTNQMIQNTQNIHNNSNNNTMIFSKSFSTLMSSFNRTIYAASSITPSPSSSPSTTTTTSQTNWNKEIVIYQYQTCPFCNKVRAYLDYNKIPYTIVEVNPVTKSQIKFSKEYKQVPIVKVDNIQLNDSTQIIRTLEEMRLQNSKQKQTSKDLENENKWMNWTDNKLVYLTAPNLYTTWSESVASMDYMMEQSSFSYPTRVATKYFGAASMYGVTKFIINKKRNITDPRGQLYEACREWSNALNTQNTPFMGGDVPNLADVASFGVWRALMGFQTGRDILDANNSSQEWINWYKRMETRVGTSSAVNPSNTTVAANWNTNLNN